MRNNSKGVDKLKLLEIKTYYVTEAELDAYVITFEFAGKEFIAIVHVDEDSTNIVVCLERYVISRKGIDIPTYFGTGFASDIYNFIYEEIDKIEKKYQK